MLAAYFFTNALETLLLVIFLVGRGSEADRQVFLNMSPMLLMLVVILLVIALVFAFLGLRSLRHGFHLPSSFTRVLRESNLQWRMLAIFLSLSVFAWLLLTQNAESFSFLRNYYLQVQPIIAWFFVLSAQAAFVMLVLLAFFAVQGSPLDRSAIRRELLCITLLFAILSATKLLLTNNAHGLVNWDDMEYFFSSWFMQQGNLFAYEDAMQIPPLYPALLTWSMPFNPYAFELIKLANILLSSSIVFPIYLTARQLLSARTSRWVALLACLLPFHILFPQRIQSENLYFPLLYWAIFLILASPRDARQRFSWDVLTGFCLGELYLTRYITLAALPAFFLGWCLKELKCIAGNLRITKDQALRFSTLLLAALVIYLPWLLAGQRHDFSAKAMLGLSITANVQNLAQLSLVNLLQWALIYAAYLILMAAPVLPLLFLSLKQAFQQRRSQLMYWLFFTAALLGSFWIAVVRHSWRANYNVDLPTKIMGRYFIFLTPLFLISAFLALQNAHDKQVPSLKRCSLLKDLLLFVLLPFTLVAFSHTLIIQRAILPMSAGVINKWGSMDGYLIILQDGAFLPLILLFYIILIFLLRRSNLERAFAVLAVSLLIYFAASLPAYFNDLQDFNLPNTLGKQMAYTIIDRYPQDYSSQPVRVFLPVQFSKTERQHMYMSIRIRGIHQLTTLSYDPLSTAEAYSDGDFVLVPLSDDAASVYDYQLRQAPLTQTP